MINSEKSNFVRFCFLRVKTYLIIEIGNELKDLRIPKVDICKIPNILDKLYLTLATANDPTIHHLKTSNKKQLIIIYHL